MSMTELKMSFPTEKLDALRFFMGKKEQSIEKELQDYLDKTYEKVVPAQLREYLENRIEQTSTEEQASEQDTEKVPAPKDCPARPSRRQREQAATEQSSAPEAPSETKGPAEQENQGMTMGMSM